MRTKPLLLALLLSSSCGAGRGVVHEAQLGHVETASREVCASPPRVEAPALPADYEDTAPITVRETPQGASLETAGASAGRVLAELARVRRRPLVARGRGALVRIYARVQSAPWEALFASVTDAAGLALAESEQGATALDPHEAERIRLERVHSQALLAPLETRVVPARHPGEAAHVIARLLLSCRGSAFASPASNRLVLRDTRDALDLAERLLNALEATSPPPVDFVVPRERAGARGEEDDARSACPFIAPRAPVNAAGAALLATLEGSAAHDAVVGCGGDRPAWVAGRATPTTSEPERLAAQFGVRFFGLRGDEGGPHPWTFGGDAHWHTRVRQQLRQSAVQPPHLRTFATRAPTELAAVAAHTLASDLRLAAYEPTGTLVAVGSEPSLRQLGELVRLF